MDDPLASTVSRLRQRAAQCREMARAALAETIARELESIAHEYEEDADRLEDHAEPS